MMDGRSLDVIDFCLNLLLLILSTVIFITLIELVANQVIYRPEFLEANMLGLVPFFILSWILMNKSTWRFRLYCGDFVNGLGDYLSKRSEKHDGN